MPLKVLSWKSLNTWWNTATLMSIPRPLYFMPTSNASLVSGPNSRSSALAAGEPTGDRRSPEPCRLTLTRQRRAVEVEPARLVAARIAGVGQQLVGRLKAEHDGARQLVLGLLAIERQEPPGTLGMTHGICWSAAAVGAGETSRRSHRLLSTQVRVEPLGLARVARADGQLELSVIEKMLWVKKATVVAVLVVQIVDPRRPGEDDERRRQVARQIVERRCW